MSQTLASTSDLLSLFVELSNKRFILKGLVPTRSDLPEAYFRVVRVFETGHLLLELLNEEKDNRIFTNLASLSSFQVCDEVTLDTFIRENREELVSVFTSLL